ncbi:aminopeptidase P family protein [Halieaceae bacterium IMCC14734]|uniref:Aminopeptidase P family protein n=2 Tax=Candidatus Litorirhabdus singularis TaxID=2518993 RepID=A0ABT3TFG2_9GAMM|nr:aminopeptidase P family protein [Candidatus Litorirhabdus singularis]
MEPYSDRLESLRAQMAEQQLDALLVPRADEYLGEYLPAYNERMAWLSGFSGSAGAVVVLRESAAIFVDGRYTLQVRQQVSQQLFSIHSLIDEPPLQWLKAQLSPGQKVGYDPRMHTQAWALQAQSALARSEQELVALERNLIDTCWQDRPVPQSQPAMLLEEMYTGQASADKRAQIGSAIRAAGADVAYIFAADSCAWLLNIRGRDIPCLPLVLGSGLLYANGEMQFFCDPDKIPAGFAEHVGTGVEVFEEASLAQVFASLSGKVVLHDAQAANAWSRQQLEKSGARVLVGTDPVELPKACKNPVQVQGMRDCHIRDAVAEVQFLAWLDAEVAAGRLHDEAQLSDQLFGYRAAQDLFQETSFDTISAAAGNAAMAHYNHLNGEPSRLGMDSVYLVDSGGQYLDGTTDITRTVAIGKPAAEVRRSFTLVLKGCIALAQARFPAGTSGASLDILARQFLWQQGLDYEHGTGHGVGSFLSVHEGPQRIGKGASDVALRPGMVVSDEPGYYKSEEYGMRCENLLVVIEVGEMVDSGKQLLAFETLTLVPFDRRLLDRDLLTGAELTWLNEYHSRVCSVLSPRLDGDDLTWLERTTRPL